MEYALSVDNELEKEIEVSLPTTELNKYIDRRADILRKKVGLKGFRKGKVPKVLVKTHFAERLKSESINELVNVSFLKVLKEKKWRPASLAKVSNFEEGEEIKFKLHFEILPDFEVENYLGLEIMQEQALPDDFLLEQGLKGLRERYAKLEEISRPAAVDDLATIDLDVFNHDRLEASDKNLKIKIGDRSYPDEINRNLVGIKKGIKKIVKVGSLVYKITTRKVEEKILPTFDDRLARQVGLGNAEELKNKILSDMKKMEKKRIEDDMKESLANIILERNKFKVPNVLTKFEYEDMLRKEKLPDSDSNKERFWNIAEKRARFNLIIDKIADKEDIKVTKNAALDLIRETDVRLTDENRADLIDYMTTILRREKVLDFLFKNSKITQKSRIISPKEVADANRSVRH